MPAVDLLLYFEDEQITSMSKSLSSQSWLVVTGRFANWFTVQIIISVILLQIISLINQSKEASQSSIYIHVKNTYYSGEINMFAACYETKLN